jgi:hypothetical protein
MSLASTSLCCKLPGQAFGAAGGVPLMVSECAADEPAARGPGAAESGAGAAAGTGPELVSAASDNDPANVGTAAGVGAQTAISWPGWRCWSPRWWRSRPRLGAARTPPENAAPGSAGLNSDELVAQIARQVQVHRDCY